MSAVGVRRITWIAGFAIVLCFAGASSIFADSKQPGTVSGTVLTTDDKPAVGFALRLQQDIPMEADKGGTRRPNSALPGDAGGLQGGRENVKIVARVTTDKEGKFNFTNVPEGAYTLVGGSNSVGWIWRAITVEAGQDVQLGDLKLVKVR